MKRHLSTALLLFALCGCAIDDSYQAIRTEEKQITITAIREDGDDPETRTVRNEKGKVYWSKGDQISLFYGQGSNGGSVFTSNQEADTVKVTNFVGTITAITGGGEISADQTYFWGLYPYNENASCDGNSITTTLSSHQEAYPGSYANGTNISVGRSQGLIMGFYNACGGFRFSLNKEGVKKVTFRGNNGENLVGKLKISFVNGKINTEILEGENEVVLEAPAGEYFEPGVLYYIVLAPTVLENGFTVKAETFTEETTFKYETSITIEATNFKSKKLMDTGLTWTKKTGNIPVEDANFKVYLLDNYDNNGDKEISFEEAEQITSILVYNTEITSLKGIEYMPELVCLECLNTGLKSVDLSGNSKLSILDLSNKASLNNTFPSYITYNGRSLSFRAQYLNEIESLNTSNNRLLTILEVDGNQLTTLDISNNIELTKLNCNGNQLTDLIVSENPQLTTLYCARNNLSTLYLSNNSHLQDLNCGNNSLTDLDLSENTDLIRLSCSYNQIWTLSLPNSPSLTYLTCRNNYLTSLDVSKNPALSYLECFHNGFTSLDVSNNTELTELRCGMNSIQPTIDVSNCTQLIALDCSANKLTSLDVSNNPKLKTLRCNTNQLTLIDVSKNSSLVNLGCSSNQLTELNVSENTALVQLICYENQLSVLDVSKNVALTRLDCWNNQLTSLDVSKNTDLTRLDCSPMNNNDGDNLLGTLYIYQGQEIPNITVDRNSDYIPVETEIVVKPDDGGTGDNTDDEL